MASLAALVQEETTLQKMMPNFNFFPWATRHLLSSKNFPRSGSSPWNTNSWVVFCWIGRTFVQCGKVPCQSKLLAIAKKMNRDLPMQVQLCFNLQNFCYGKWYVTLTPLQRSTYPGRTYRSGVPCRFITRTERRRKNLFLFNLQSWFIGTWC